MEEQNFRKNPIITDIYTADPAPTVYGDTLYLYTTHDEDELINCRIMSGNEQRASCRKRL